VTKALFDLFSMQRGPKSRLSWNKLPKQYSTSLLKCHIPNTTFTSLTISEVPPLLCVPASGKSISQSFLTQLISTPNSNFVCSVLSRSYHRFKIYSKLRIEYYHHRTNYHFVLKLGMYSCGQIKATTKLTFYLIFINFGNSGF
jgi:hypothetical protein